MKRIVYKEDNIEIKVIKNILDNDGIIVYPTDTVYGVAASINSIKGLKKVYEAKERNFKSPLIALLSKVEYIEKIAVIDKKQKELINILAKNFWPGALTIILNKKNNVPDIMVSNGLTVGIRIPALKLAQDIIESVGGILPTTSANISGERTPKSYDELNEKFIDRVDLIVDGGETPLGVESTILDLTKDNPTILREGAIKKEEIEKLIGKL
ncbi:MULTISPECIES: L-threonylcarbamoyladenylate synthase [Cetobacterium]|jgi:L-threonylcarbamoyladenylate synthase|uniref:L-threonylcarbamoyladenylate synthase n=1 Tax=Candidatus Cetobacterium colombiensis TaxID=3073100 RepID=A0ABU4WCK5_9FUSO|nr:L-threonylcarbamoyladenylate synthase [Candidatus Cetobacterium colombiensis]MDX8336444.1 L-threonylcarbamoyladenylate synthase [Candidatus Cetobacterium colombiensis]